MMSCYVCQKGIGHTIHDRMICQECYDKEQAEARRVEIKFVVVLSNANVEELKKFLTTEELTDEDIKDFFMTAGLGYTYPFVVDPKIEEM